MPIAAESRPSVVEDIDATSNLKVEYGWAPGIDQLMYVRTPSTTTFTDVPASIPVERGHANHACPARAQPTHRPTP